MKIAILADTHGNLTALNTVLAALENENLDQMICLGDVAAMGPHPHECLQKIQSLNIPVVLGNTDDWLIHPSSIPEDDTPVFNIMRWCAEQMTETDQVFLKTFQDTIEAVLEDTLKLLCFHGSPTDFNDIIMSTSPDEEMAKHFSGVDAKLVMGGHTHVQLLRRFEDKLYINPGSVGLPCRYYPNLHGGLSLMGSAEYAVITAADDQISVDLRSIPLEVDRILKAADDGGMPHVDWWKALWDNA